MAAPGLGAADDAAEGLGLRADSGAGAEGAVGWRPAVFNVADDDPAGRGEVEAFARRLLELPAVDEEDDDDGGGGSDAAADAAGSGSSSRARGSRGGGEALEEKRVTNAKLKAALGVRLRHPTYREGLAAIARGDRAPFAGAGDVEALLGGARR